MVWQFAELFAGGPIEEMRGSWFTVTRLFMMAHPADCFLVVYPALLFSSMLNTLQGRDCLLPVCLYSILFHASQIASKSLFFLHDILIDTKRFFSVIKGMQGPKSLEFQWNWLLNCSSESLFSVLSAARQLGVGVFMKSHTKSCFFKGLWIRIFSSPATWIYQCLRGTVRITPQLKLFVSLLIKWY